MDPNGAGALLFFALLGISGLVMQCTSCVGNNSGSYSRSSSAEGRSTYCYNDPIICINCPDSGSGSGSGSDSGEAFIVVVLFLVIVFAIIGIFYGIFAATIGFQRIFQRHYHILTKRKLTEVLILNPFCRDSFCDCSYLSMCCSCRNTL